MIVFKGADTPSIVLVLLHWWTVLSIIKNEEKTSGETHCADAYGHFGLYVPHQCSVTDAMMEELGKIENGVNNRC